MNFVTGLLSSTGNTPNATPLKGFIVFSAENWPKTYSEKSRTYEVHSDNKAFRPNASSCSLFGSSLDGTDQGVRLDWYMADFGIPGGWAVERCIIKEPVTRVDFTPNDIEAVYDEIDRRIDAEIGMVISPMKRVKSTWMR